MAHSPETVQAVRGSYVFERLPLPVAAIKHGVSQGSAQAWKKKALDAGDDWDRARSAALMAAGGLGDATNQILEGFTLLFQTAIQKVHDDKKLSAEDMVASLARLSDSYAKMLTSAGKSNPKISKLAIAMEVLNEEAVLIKAEFPDDVERFAKILDSLGPRICEVFG